MQKHVSFFQCAEQALIQQEEDHGMRRSLSIPSAQIQASGPKGIPSHISHTKGRTGKGSNKNKSNGSGDTAALHTPGGTSHSHPRRRRGIAGVRIGCRRVMQVCFLVDKPSVPSPQDQVEETNDLGRRNGKRGSFRTQVTFRKRIPPSLSLPHL